jgi:hypothetical protein
MICFLWGIAGAATVLVLAVAIATWNVPPAGHIDGDGR